MSADDNLKPQLLLNFSQQQALAKLSYRVRNLASRPIFIFNKFFRHINAARQLVLEPDLCVIEVRDNVAYVGKKLFPVPPNLRVEAHYYPCVTELAAGQELAEELTLAVPLRQWNPYTLEGPAQTVRELPLIFELGYFFAAPGSRRLAETVQTTLGPALRFDPFPITSQLVVASRRLPYPVSVFV